jgi:long-chain acyl-CoA synthetase
VLANAISKENLAFTVSDNEFKLDLEVVGICSVNREEWLVTDLACNLIDVTSVPLYETLGDDMLDTVLGQTEMTTLFGSDVCLKNILKLVNGKSLNLKKMVTFDKVVSDQLKEAAEACKITLISYHELLETYKG